MTTIYAEVTPDAVVKRLEKLERENRSLKVGVFVLAFLMLPIGLWILTMWNRNEPLARETIEAHDIRVWNLTQGTAIELDGTQENETDFHVGNYSTPRARVLSGKDGVGLSLFDLNTTKIKVSGSYNPNPSAAFFVSNDGSRALRLYDDNGFMRASLSHTLQGPRLDFYDASGRSRLSIGLDKDGQPFLGSWDAYGKPLAVK